jgi:hypothetical protein
MKLIYVLLLLSILADLFSALKLKDFSFPTFANPSNRGFQSFSGTFPQLTGFQATITPNVLVGGQPIIQN